jgi:hypothetical protein
MKIHFQSINPKMDGRKPSDYFQNIPNIVKVRGGKYYHKNKE